MTPPYKGTSNLLYYYYNLLKKNNSRLAATLFVACMNLLA
tara:strand:- start:50 stop:169 length:120 start_codon:yes stop_codon:yes gene_type:complete